MNTDSTLVSVVEKRAVIIQLTLSHLHNLPSSYDLPQPSLINSCQVLVCATGVVLLL